MLHQITNLESLSYYIQSAWNLQTASNNFTHSHFSGCTNGVLQRNILTTDTNQTLKYVLSPEKSKEMNSIIL